MVLNLAFNFIVGSKVLLHGVCLIKILLHFTNGGIKHAITAYFVNQSAIARFMIRESSSSLASNFGPPLSIWLNFICLLGVVRMYCAHCRYSCDRQVGKKPPNLEGH